MLRANGSGKAKMNPSDLSALSVFVVDDNRNMLNTVKAMLNALSITNVTVFTQALDALKALKTSAPDLVITDWNMMPMSGIDLFRRIRNDADVVRQDIPVLMLTGNSDIEKVMQAKEAGVSGYLTKPVSPRLLHDRITDVCKVK